MLWTDVLKNNFTKKELLCDYLELSPSLRENVLQSSPFPLNLPLRLAQKIEKNSLVDPILRQFVPLIEEENKTANYTKDPIAECSFFKAKKLLHKYPSRVLIVTTSACAMHCRFCFRRHFPYAIGEKTFDHELELIRNNSTIEEVILSGGDPLSLHNKTLHALFEALHTITHVKRIRFHTRFPIGIPERIDPGFLDLLENTQKQCYFVLHCNHSKELDEDVLHALKQVQKKGVPVLNQAVLLKGVNDSFEAQEALSLSLINHGILPYYLHQLDQVEGATHYEVEETKGLAIIAELQNSLSGYGVPKYVREIPGKCSKTVIHPHPIDNSSLA